MILTQDQAAGALTAMRAMKYVGGICGDLTLAEGVRVQWLSSITVRNGLSGPREEYKDQYAFAEAYGLN